MMNCTEVLKELELYANASTKQTLLKHGAKEPFFGVRVGDLKKILKKTKKNHELSLELYATGNSDAMYLAGLMADEKQLTKEQLNTWVKQAYWYYLSEFTVPWIASETPHGFELGIEWIKSSIETTSAAGWATLANYAALTPDQDLDIKSYETLLNTVQKDIHSSQNRVRYAMNSFVIAVGAHIIPLVEKAKEVALHIGKVNVEMGGTACKVPIATEYIQKIEERGSLGKKKKMARC